MDVTCATSTLDYDMRIAPALPGGNLRCPCGAPLSPDRHWGIFRGRSARLCDRCANQSAGTVLRDLLNALTAAPRDGEARYCIRATSDSTQRDFEICTSSGR